jgi:Phage related hypothetical protein (DUF1799)
MRVMNASAEEVEKARAAMEAQMPEDTGFDVYDDNWESVMCFSGVGTQWQYAGPAAVRTGLSYPGVSAFLHLRVRSPARRAAVFDDIQVMEAAVLKGERDERESTAWRANAEAARS